MAVIPVEKINIVATKVAKGPIISFLQKAEIIELREICPPDIQHCLILPREQELDDELAMAEIKNALEFLDKMSNKKKGFIESFLTNKEKIDEEFFREICHEFDYRSIVAQLKELDARLGNLQNLESRLRIALQTILPWSTLPVKLNMLKRPYLCITPVVIPAKNLVTLGDETKKNPLMDLETVNTTGDKAYVVIVHKTCESSQVNEILALAGGEIAALPFEHRTPAEEIAEIKKILRHSAQEKKEIMSHIHEMQKHSRPLSCVYDRLFEEVQRSHASQKMAETSYTFVVEGWIKKRDFEKASAGIKNISPASVVTRVEPEKDEQAPTVIENPKIFTPFELITKIFGMPDYKQEIDPTLPLSGFFIFFFGLCLSDAGYGLLLLLISTLFLKKLELPTGGKSLFILLAVGGAVSILVGIFTGTYFGFDVSQAGDFAAPLKILKLFDPVNNPLQMLVFSLGVGVVQILFGILLKMIEEIRCKNYAAALLDHGLWMYFLSSLVFMVATMAGNPLAVKMTISGAVLLVLTQGRREKNLIKKLVFGLLSLYSTTSYLGDTLSYSRLLALMMTTSIIGTVINILAVLTRDSVPFVGYVIMVVILLVGHVFNLIISVLSAFVHSLRLQLVEFFSKFYSGSGKEFQPFRRETKYTIIIN